MATATSSLITSARRHLKEIYNLVTPGSPLVSPQGTTGATTYTYLIVANNDEGSSEASAVGTTATGNASLSVSNFNRLTWTAVPYATTYDIYRTVGGGSTGAIAQTTSLTADDTGLAGDSTTAPTVNTSGVANAFWTDSELLDLATKGYTDLWAAIIDLNEDHFQTIDTSTMTLVANATTITGTPTNLFRVRLIEPADTTSSGTSRDIVFSPRDYNHPDFVYARSQSAFAPAGDNVIFYVVTGAGSPVAAPTIVVAPKISATMSLRVAYVPILGVSSFTVSTSNPIPGESDNAVIAWIVAFARAKEREDRSPDPNWLSVYATEKQSLLTRMTPRQTQEPEYVEGTFEGYY